jgi:hypothetical protein
MIGSHTFGFVPFGGTLIGGPLYGWTEQPNQNDNGWGSKLPGPAQWAKEGVHNGYWIEQPPNDVDTIKPVSDQ